MNYKELNNYFPGHVTGRVWNIYGYGAGRTFLLRVMRAEGVEILPDRNDMIFRMHESDFEVIPECCDLVKVDPTGNNKPLITPWGPQH